MNPFSIEFSISRIKSFTDPIIFCSLPFSVVHIGSGIPQNLDLDKFQSFAFCSQLPNLPSPVALGFQLILELLLIKDSLFSVTFTNHEFSG